HVARLVAEVQHDVEALEGARGRVSPAVVEQQLTLRVDAEASRVEAGLPLLPVVGIEVVTAQGGVLRPQPGQATIERQERGADAVVGEGPPQWSRAHATPGPAVILR